MPEIKCGDSKLQFILTQENDQLWLELHDLTNGKQWGKAPLLIIDVHDKALRRNVTIRQFRIDRIEQLPDGVHVVVGHRSTGVEIGLWVRIILGELSIMLQPSEVYERHQELHRLFCIDILPGMLSVGPGGTLVLPVNTGMLCDPAKKSKCSDKFLIYGEQDRWELMPSMPVLAAYQNNAGITAIATRGACDTECRVNTDGCGNGSIGFAFSLRRFWPDPVDLDIREFRYTPIPQKVDYVQFAAKRLRRHVMDDLGKKTLRKRAQESESVAYLINAYTMKMFHGMENAGYIMADSCKSDPVSFLNLLTFPEALANLKKLHDAGVTKILTQSVGWNTRGHDGLYPTRFPIEERLGGEKKFMEMVASGNSLGFHMNVHDNMVMAAKASPDFNPDYVIHDIYGQPLVHGCWAAGIEYSHWVAALPPDRLGGHLQRMKALGLRGMYYMDYMPQPLEVNYHPKFIGPRSQCARGFNKALAEARSIFGSVGAENGFMCAAIDADSLASRPKQSHLNSSDPSWPVMSFLDKRVPIWQMVLHDLVSSENHEGLTWRNAMDLVLFGDHPRDEWSARPGIMPILDDRRIRAIKTMSDFVLGSHLNLQTEELMKYEEPAENMRQTTFADGTVVTVDDAKQELFVNNRKVEKLNGLLD